MKNLVYDVINKIVLKLTYFVCFLWPGFFVLQKTNKKNSLCIDKYLEVGLSNQPKFGKGAPIKCELKPKVIGGPILLLLPWSPDSGVRLTNENNDIAFWRKWYLEWTLIEHKLEFIFCKLDSKHIIFTWRGIQN